MTSGGKPSRKDKKNAQRKKNRKIWERFLMTEAARGQVERDGGLAAPEYEPEAPKQKTERQVVQQQHVESRLEEIRNRTSQRRMRSQERWNRFSGTSDAGGRGL